MAALGRREVSKKKNPDSISPVIGVAAPAVNLVAAPTVLQPVTTLDVQPSPIGSPIMREDFITRTGSKSS